MATSSSGMHILVGCRTPDGFFLFMEPRDTSVMLWIWPRGPIVTWALGHGKSSNVNSSTVNHKESTKQFYRVNHTSSSFFFFPLIYLHNIDLICTFFFTVHDISSNVSATVPLSPSQCGTAASVWAFETSAPSPASSHRWTLRCHCHARGR